MLTRIVEDECKRLVEEEKYSLTWAVEQMPLLMRPIVSGRDARVIKGIEALKAEELHKTKMFLAEEKGKREALAANDLVQRGEFWMIDSVLLTSTEQFIREAKREVSRSDLLDLVYGDAENSLNHLLVVPNGHTPVCKSLVLELFDIAHFRGQVQERRLDVKWVKQSDRWFSQNQIFTALMEADGYQNFELYRQFESSDRKIQSMSANVHVPRQFDQITSEGLEDFHSVKTLSNLYILPVGEVAKFFMSAPKDWEEDLEFLMTAYWAMYAAALSAGEFNKEMPEIFSKLRKALPEQLLASSEKSLIACQTLWDEVNKLECYDPFSWKQRQFDY